MHAMRRAAVVVVVGVCGVASNVGCRGSSKAATSQARTPGPVIVAAAWPWASRHTFLYGEGLHLAQDEINAAGGVLGRPLQVLREDDGESLEQGRHVAQRIAQNRDVVGVIGHMQSYVTVSTASIYDSAGLLMIAPTSTDPTLTQRGYRFVFRTTFTDGEIGRRMADHAVAHDYKRVAIFYIRNDYGRGLANAFEERAVERGLAVVDRQSYDANSAVGERAVDQVVATWRELNLNAVFIAGEAPRAAALIAAVRAARIGAAVLGSDAMAIPELVQLGGRAVEGAVLPAAFHPGERRPEVERFSTAFGARFHRPPDTAAAMGYDALRLFAHAANRAGSVDSAKVADALRRIEDFAGVTGVMRFGANGDLIVKSMLKVVVKGGRFEPLEERMDLAAR